MGLGSSPLKGCIVAAGACDCSGGAAAVIGQRGGVVGYTGVGVYTITLDAQNAVDATEGIVLVTPGATARATHQIVHTSDTVKTVTFRDGAAVPAAVDIDFHWMVVRFAP